MDNGIFGFVKAHLKEAKIGGFLGLISGGTFLFTTGGNWYHLVGEWTIRLVFTVIIAIASAIATAAAKDWYQRYKESRKLKIKNNEQRKEKDRAA